MGDHTVRTSRSPSVSLPGPDSSHSSSPHYPLSTSIEDGGAAYSVMYPSIESNGPYPMQETAFLNPSSPHPFSDSNFPGVKRNSIGSRPASLHLSNSNYNQFQDPFQTQDSSSFLIDPALQNNQSINPADIMAADQETVARHSRHPSLDPNIVALPQSTQGDWSSLGALSQGHRRAPSEHSEMSSVGQSPYIKQDGFDNYHNHSPMLHPQQDQNVYPNSLGLERFTISDPTQHGLSPRHSPFPSPRMAPMQPTLNVTPVDPFVLQSNDRYGNNAGPEIYSPEMGQAPAITLSFVPTKQVDDMMAHENDHDALSPPVRNRGRANSAPMSRPLSPDATTPSFDTSRQRSLSPFDQHFSSREMSPGGPKSSRRSSTSSIPNRDYILDLADPNRTTAASGGANVKVQKHPATFQCTLCPKRFTRAYNLRSHLRTHTDERPFVCTVCGKAFARQHDRKRHEGLHSGEKKFICKGELSGGGSWGCGRRFARADALGRHFRSEAGRVCIKPLLDEEAAEHQRLYGQQVMQAQGMGMVPPTLNVNGGFALPAALLAQYPALQNFQMSGPPGEEDLGHRSSFDASSQGEYYDDETEGSGYLSGPGTAYATRWTGQPEWASDYEGR